MPVGNERSQDKKEKPYDLTEEASKRAGGEDATREARQAESDDVSEETGRGAVDQPGNGDIVENRIATSLDDA